MYRHLPLCLLAGLLIGFRVLGSALPQSQPNFQPVAALFFCGALLAPGWRGFAIPFSIWAITYPLASGSGSNFAIFCTTLFALTLTFFLGKALRKRGIIMLLFGSVAAAIIFHLITNGIAWLASPIYQKSLTGLWQSLWTGPPNSVLPSWVFLRNFTAANVLFTGIFVGAQLRFPRAKVTALQALAAK